MVSGSWKSGSWLEGEEQALSGGDRYSVPYFFDMSMDSVIEGLPTCPGEAAPPVRYGDYLLERLNRNYAYRKESTV